MEENEDLAAILKANLDLSDRIAEEELAVDYDGDYDLFILSIGKPKSAITEELADGLQLRIDPENMKIIGFEVVGFRRHYLKAHPEFNRHFLALFGPKLARPEEQRERARAAARTLTPIPA